MAVTKSSVVTVAELTAILNLIGSSGALQFFDAGDNSLGTLNLPNPAGIVFNDLLVFNGLPNVIEVPLNAPVDAVPTTMAVLDGSGDVLIGGIPTIFAVSNLVLASSVANPGQTLGIISAQLSSAVL